MPWGHVKIPTVLLVVLLKCPLETVNSLSIYRPEMGSMMDREGEDAQLSLTVLTQGAISSQSLVKVPEETITTDQKRQKLNF